MATNYTTEIGTSIPNLVVESSTTSTNNGSDLFSSNDVDTEIHSSPTNSDCKNADCVKNFQISTSSDNSSASKILWNLVNTPKATTQPPVSDKIRTDEERNDLVRVSAHVPTANYSGVHNYSSANELDSEISPDYNLFEVRTEEVDTGVKESVYAHNGSFARSTESSVMITEIFMFKPDDFKENSTVDFESTEMNRTDDINDGQNASDVINMTEINTTPGTQETTIYTDTEMDFATYFDAESSVDENGIKGFHNETFPHTGFFGNLATQMPYNETLTSILDINENASTLTSTESEEVKSGNTEATVLNPESRDSLHTENSSFESEDLEKSTPIYDYITSLESEELVSKNSRKINDRINNTHSPPITTYFSNSVLTSKEMLSTAPVNLSDILPIPTIPFSEVKDIFYKRAFTTANTDSTGITTGEISSEDLKENDSTESSENIDYVVKFTEAITESSSKNKDNTDEFTEAVTESINHTYLPFSPAEFNDSTEKSDSSTTAHPESSEIADSSHVGIISKENDLFRSFQNFHNDSLNTERSMEQTYRNNSPVSDVNKEDVSTFASSIETEFEYDITTEFPLEFSVTPNTDPNINAVNVSIVQEKSSVSPHSLDSLNEIESNVSSTETVPLDSKIASVSSTKKNPATESSAADDIFVEKASTMSSVNQTLYISTTSNLESQREIIKQTSNTMNPTSDTKTELQDTNIDSSTDVSENWPGVFSSNTDLAPPQTETATVVNISKLNTDVESTTLVESHPDETSPVNVYETVSITEKTLVPEDITTHFSEDAKQQDRENNFQEITTHSERTNIETSKVDVVTKMVLLSTMFSSTRHFDTVPISRMPEIDVTSPSSAASSTSSVTETHREGKHIPFSTTVVRRTTAKPVINTTTKSSLFPHYETTENSPINVSISSYTIKKLSIHCANFI